MSKTSLTSIAIAAAGLVFAMVAGYFLWRYLDEWRQLRRHKASISARSDRGNRAKADEPNTSSSLNDAIIEMMRKTTLDFTLKKGRRIIPEGIFRPKGVVEQIRLAGLDGTVSSDAYSETCFRLAVAGAVAGFAFGSLFSIPLALILAAVLGFLGFRMPDSALKFRIGWRANETERHLPEMLDVVALGMRSGLSFDSSLKLYTEHFDTVLAKEMSSARNQWSSGLSRRDEALRKLAATYDSMVFGRVVETVIRSIRYGSSMVTSLERDAADARNAYQSQRQERIAKAPVKMMIPTGVLILPAMLIMVLGPVLLELMGGGF